MQTNKNRKQITKTRKITKRRRQTKNNKRRSNKKRETRKNGGMLRQFTGPALSAVKTVGTEYAKDQAQKIFRDKPNVLKDITNTYNKGKEQSIYRGFTPTDENYNPNIMKQNLGQNIKKQTVKILNEKSNNSFEI